MASTVTLKNSKLTHNSQRSSLYTYGGLLSLLLVPTLDLLTVTSNTKVTDYI